MTRRMLLASLAAQGGRPVPVLDGAWWKVAGNPDLGPLTSPEQEPVDFGIWQAIDGTWQLWSCIRKTKAPGATRLFYRWQGRNLTDPDWQPMGIAMIADPGLGEVEGSLQAPFCLRIDGIYHLFYSSGGRFALLKSEDGKSFARVLNRDGKVGLFGTPGEGAGWGGRDIMVTRIEGLWHAYYTASDETTGRDFVRSSPDLVHWSKPREVAFGGEGGSNRWSAECPWVYRLPDTPWYFLFRTQQYKPGAQMTRVYRSRDPYDFGIGDDGKLVARLPVAAPEVVESGGRVYLAALDENLKGIRVCRLRFDGR
jgi:hypothetical protein